MKTLQVLVTTGILMGFGGLIFMSAKGQKNDDIDLSFPDDFLLGTASSSYQVEGAWNVDGKSESNWDYFAHNYSARIADGSNGDVACDSYYKYKEDIALIKDLGLNHYRFSLSWPRILPNGFKGPVNKKGLQYYHSILDELERQGIEPFVTIYHWDHPVVLEQIGGWMNELMIDAFLQYAKVVFQEFGPRVKYFATVNEPFIYCMAGYKWSNFAPGLNLSHWGEYICHHNMLKAHARAYHLYDEQFRQTQNGQIGLVIPCRHYFTKAPSDFESSDTGYEYECGWTANPIFSEHGDYPAVMRRKIQENSKFEGRDVSRLPKFSKEWIEYIKGTSDYFGLNHYTSHVAVPAPLSTDTVWQDDHGLIITQDSSWPSTQSDWLKVIPEGFGHLLRTIKTKYNNPPVYVLECGTSDPNPQEDNIRINFLYSYMKEMLIAMKRDGCDVRAFTVWSFLDNYEWSDGYTANFGLFHVDFNDPNRKRTPKKSVSWLKKVVKSRRLVSPDE